MQSACGLCINVGSFSDPIDVPGLAHLLEHSKLRYQSVFSLVFLCILLCMSVFTCEFLHMFILPFYTLVVFMGSDKYPGDNALDLLTNRHGGFDNASTDYEKVTMWQKFFLWI